MKTRVSLLLALLQLMLVPLGFAANPFLSAKSNEPVSAKFKGTEWNDEFEKEEYAWSTRVTTQRVATAKWGAFFKIAFDQITTRAPRSRKMLPLYFFTTDNEIVLFNEEKPEEAIAQAAGKDEPPKFEPSDIYGLVKGSRKIPDGNLSTVTLAVKGDKSSYAYSHNSGHFTRFTWQSGVGLVEVAQGYGAHKDGYSLKRDAAGKK